MKLSIITVNLNNRDGLRKTIDSVVSQTFKDFEWIVIDGGSTDGSRELIEQYADHFAYWVSEPDKGIYNAMNKGIKVAKGEYLQFLNSGDILYSPTIIDDVFSIGSTRDILYGDILIINDDGHTDLITYSDRLSIKQLLNHSICHQSSFIKRELLRKEPYDENLQIVSDWKFFLRKALEGIKFEHIPLIVSVFDTEGISSTKPTLLSREREMVLASEVPDCIICANEELNRLIEYRNTIVNDWQIDAILKLRESRRIYRKILTVTLRLLESFDNVLSRSLTNK